MTFVAAAVVGGAALASGYMSSKAAGDAADAQSAAANQANETQRYMYDTTRKDNAPFMERGNAAGNRLQYLLGLSAPGKGTTSSNNTLAGARLVDTSGGIPQYNADLYNSNPAYRAAWDEVAAGHFAKYGQNYNQWSDGSRIEDVLRSKLADQISQDTSTAQQAQDSDPAYGSLMRRFSMDDLNNDPVYKTGLQFGLDEGNKGIERQAAASGSMLSGATLKALSKYATDYAGTKAGEAYNRFTNDQTTTYNRLAGVAGTGQQANALVDSAGMNTANNISQNQLGVGNARAASAIGSANGWSSAIGQGINGYQQNQLLKQLQGNPGYSNWASNNSGVMSSAGLSANDLNTAF